ncbi:DoxX family protein [Sulfurovum sp. ST-21]|uniref:DoxX family protein n=1 Tax=Sulfurovum indicum TaxID=2779528 RepID=A0A7M1S7Z5_9BACT|nr:DoxX family protein [Sulfurovum indicum]QOR62839.1 DoxX family protein [Sulfurovum indicum]
MRDFLAEYSVLVSYPKHLVLFFARIAVAYGFTYPALLKMQDMQGTVKWFESIGIPFASLMGMMVSYIEMLGIICLTLGLFTRYISILLSFVMMGAIFFVHWKHGFPAADNGIEIPLYYFIFLMLFASFGPGKYSLDRFVFGEGKGD